MNAHVKAARAISTEYANRLLRSLVLTILIAGAIALGVGALLTYFVSKWFLLILLPFSVVVVAITFGIFVFTRIIRTIQPAMSTVQKDAVIAYVSKIERVSEGVKTPYFIIVFRVLRDVFRQREPSFLVDMRQDSTTLAADFKALSRLFG